MLKHKVSPILWVNTEADQEWLLSISRLLFLPLRKVGQIKHIQENCNGVELCKGQKKQQGTKSKHCLT